MFYLIVIALSSALIFAANLLLGGPVDAPRALSLAASVAVSVAAAFALDGIGALVIRRLTPASWYSPERKIFAVSKAERRLYNRLKIKLWKDSVPELGGFTGFHKDRLLSMSDRDYLERFITEANFGAVIHLANALLCPVIILIPLCRPVGIWLPVVAVNFILSMLPFCILRHTEYTLQKLYTRSLSRDSAQREAMAVRSTYSSSV